MVFSEYSTTRLEGLKYLFRVPILGKKKQYKKRYVTENYIHVVRHGKAEHILNYVGHEDKSRRKKKLYHSEQSLLRATENRKWYVIKDASRRPEW